MKLQMQTLISKLHGKRIEIIPVLLILALGLISVTWFRGNYLIKGGDSFLPLSAPFALKEIASQAWAPSATGAPSPLNIVGYFFNIQMIFLKSLGISIVIQQKMLFYFLFTLSGLGMYALFSTLTTDENRQIGSLAAALFYMMNSYALTIIWGRQTGALFTYALMPLFLTLFVKGLFSKKGYFKYLFLILIIWLLVPMSMTNPGFWLPIWMVQFSFLIFFIAINRENKIAILHALRFSGLLVLLWLFLNLWWILPLSFLVRQVYQGIGISGEPAEIFQWTSPLAALVNSLRLLGDWTIYAKYGSDPYFSWASIYLTPFFILFSFAPPLLAFASLLFKSMRKYTIFFATLAVAGLFLIKGPQPPFGWLNTLWFKILPFSGVFRSTYEKLGIVVALSYAFLIGASIVVIFKYLKSRPKGAWVKSFKPLSVLFLVLIFLILYGVLAFPFWSGEVIWAGGNVRPSIRIQVPEYYYKTAKWFENQPKVGKVLTLPPILLTGTSAYKWKHGYFGSDPIDEYFIQRPIVGSPTGIYFADDFQKNAITNLVTQNSETASKMLGLLNVKYILVHRDFNLQYAFPYLRDLSAALFPEQLEKILMSQKQFEFVRAFGELAIYQLKSDFFVPQIYAATNSEFFLQDEDSWEKMLRGMDSSMSQVFFSLKPDEAKRYIEVRTSVHNNQKLEVSFKRVSPTLYHVKVKNLSGPFYLVFLESFHPQWKAYKGNVNWFQALLEKPVEEERHLRANGYANSWFIDEKGDFEMTLYFWPQSLVYLGLIISGITLLVCLGFFIKSLLPKSDATTVHSE